MWKNEALLCVKHFDSKCVLKSTLYAQTLFWRYLNKPVWCSYDDYEQFTCRGGGGGGVMTRGGGGGVMTRGTLSPSTPVILTAGLLAVSVRGDRTQNNHCQPSITLVNVQLSPNCQGQRNHCQPPITLMGSDKLPTIWWDVDDHDSWQFYNILNVDSLLTNSHQCWF